ncbi:phage repressor protein [Ligilactobacillus murinus]|uniref:BRO-N domain-containing protein n=1 Tax=Ligilactobacillus murinus TaxID=1622 RepID=UPI0010727A6D|nr:BRO family protein [Ligilactobacillus murinus]MBF0757320.1 phage repressor protein [Ligilactobacillus murinus]MBF0832602.1 phage repressor protein [Ligilactobacillus murinus]TFU66686.1 phage repressor protein [Ligilactobacillus murinus]
MQNTKLENWNGFAIRFVSVNDEWHAVLKDVAEALNYRDAFNAGKYLPEKYKGTTFWSTPGGTQELTTVSEVGLYRLISRSNKPEAQEFQEWIYNTIKQLRQSVGLEAYEAFRMLDKQKQREAMDIIKNGIDKPERRHYIKVNSIANKAISIKYGYPKAIKKDDMTPQQVAERDEIAQEVAKLMTLNDKYGLDISVSDAIYSRYSK